ncbi:MAG: hypothetical protein ACOVOR_02585 [Rhabdochlamydiaceae bacterium]
MKIFYICSLIALAPFSYSQASDAAVVETKPLQVVPVTSSDQLERAEVRIVFPQEEAVKHDESLNVQVRSRNFSLGIPTDIDRKKEILNHEEGQMIRVSIDNEPFFELGRSSLVTALRDIEDNRDDQLEKNISSPLSEGAHLIRAYAVCSFGESLKNKEAFNSSIFYYKDKSNKVNISLNDPYLTYNEPTGRFKVGAPILLDFLISNVVLSEDGYKIHLKIDDQHERWLSQYTPYYIYGLPKGDHKISISLVDHLKQPVNKKLCHVTRMITID